ncbi:hypothetical protein FACS1894142_6780 [Spirochaetia bacterium]|nr:hypothetical protein FACS1894142_6780 [Spirochaetia bacterium]
MPLPPCLMMDTMVKPEILCIGNAITDIYTSVGNKTLASLGIAPQVRHVSYERIAEVLRVLSEKNAKFVSCSGGGAANVAKIAAMLSIPAAFAGVIGTTGTISTVDGAEGGKVAACDTVADADSLGQRFKAEMQAAGVVPHLSSARLPTGVCLLLKKKDGSTAILACPSAAIEITEKDIPPGLIQDAKAVVLDGYILDNTALVHYILHTADRFGTIVALDVGNAAIAAAHAKEIAQYCRDYALILFMNEDEARAFYTALAHNGTETDDEDEGGETSPFDVLQEDPSISGMYAFFKKTSDGGLFPVIVVKQGPRGAVVFSGNRVFNAPVLAINATESTGAGDAFCAGFLAAWIRDKSIQECADLGNRVARETLNVPGTRMDRKKLDHIAKTRLEGKSGLWARG